MLPKPEILTFKTECAVKVVNWLNDRFKNIDTANRAFLHSKTQVEISVPAGDEVDIVDFILDEYNGVYGSEWFQAENSMQ